MTAESRTTYAPDCLCCELLAHKWTPQIIAVLLSGPHRFSAVHTAIPSLSEKVLSRRLAELEIAGIVTRTPYAEIPPRVEYSLTPAGQGLERVIAEMDRWSRERAPLPGGDASRPRPAGSSLAPGD